jgi:hypothetical protein
MRNLFFNFDLNYICTFVVDTGEAFQILIGVFKWLLDKIRKNNVK